MPIRISQQARSPSYVVWYVQVMKAGNNKTVRKVTFRNRPSFILNLVDFAGWFDQLPDVILILHLNFIG